MPTPFQLRLLGTGPAYPMADRSPTSSLIEYDGERILVDCGPGTVRNLATADVALDQIPNILLTHAHLDHVMELPFLIFALIDPTYEGPIRIRIGAHPGVLSWIDAMIELHDDWLNREKFELEFFDAAEGSFEMAGLNVTPYPVFHHETSLGYRFEAPDGRVLAISGDSGYCKELVDLGRKADLYLLECSLPAKYEAEKHMSPEDCNRVVRAAECRQVVLTHRYPVLEEEVDPAAIVQENWNGIVSLANDGQVYPVNI